MHNKILDYAKDKNCLLCVTPDRGGSVYSPLYTPSWRNFNSNPATWTAAQTTMTDIDVSQDYTLEIEFVYEEYNESKLIFHYTNGYGLITIWQNASNYVVITTTLLKTDGSTTDYYLTQILPSRFNVNEKNTVKVSVSGTSINIFVNGNNLVSETGKVRTNTTNVATYPMSTNIDHVYSINITNDTTGKTVWQASYEDVHEVYEPRNFAADSMTFTDSYTAQDGIGTDDFTLFVDFTLLDKGVHGTINIGCMRCIYYDSTKGYQPSVRILKSDGTKGDLYPVGTSHMTEDVASIKVIKTGQNVRMVVYARDGSTVRDLTKPLPDGATVTSSSGATTYPGNIFSASIRNDTTGETVWQAAQAELYKEVVGGMWPNPTPINFGKNPYAFYDCQAVMQEALDPTHDYKFLLDFEITKDEGEVSVFYAGAPNFPFGVYAYGDNTIRVFSNLLRFANDTGSKYATTIVYSGDTRLQGKHVIEFNIEGDTIHAFLDDNEIVHQYETVRTGTAAVGLPNCNSGYVYKIQIRDLTENRLIWNYPSEAERVNLLYKYNMTTNDGFAPSSTNTNSYVKTSLDLRNKVSNYTLFVDFEPAVFTDESTEQHQELAGQGGALIGSGYPPICSIAYYKDASAYHHIQLAQQVNSTRAVANYKFYNALTGRHKLVGTVKVNGTSNTELSIYLDGDKVSSTTASGVPNGTADSNATNFNINGQLTNYGWNHYPGKVYNCLLFDRLLTDGEIKALS